ncbi:DUF1905 domain-containing protein [Altererythrobacter arenosus]|uniref:DUF1905 domain-containing protein n=1 Tax=Altererythrobacter arenosus TaxID=3032592 RepID=A0ABY8FRV1_9SPHN|nr:DUF1905 domain-containing protein [Altererythrobacter sp. CAU 1644]WFL77742.1 DUF1905 domain-containing protein [Altererythrobacter sp. CAU 1644]
MTLERVIHTTPLQRWEGDRGTYYHVVIGNQAAEAITMHERIRRLELGSRRGFGSVKVMARIGDTQWKTSVFPSKTGEWWLLVSRKVIRAEDLALGEMLSVELELL